MKGAINRLLDLYAKCVTKGDKGVAIQQLKLHQRENIAWERDTVWRQMIGQARRGESGGKFNALGATSDDEGEMLQVPTPVGRFKITRRKTYLLAAIAVFVVMLNVRFIEGVEANRCLAVLVFCTILWATEVNIFLVMIDLY